ncbi:MAG: glycosyltransferase [Prevotellaceae bacterium]|nr:glycosyltransferase [Prevotellaceae bacterium]
MCNFLQCMNGNDVDVALISYNEDSISDFRVTEGEYTTYMFPVFGGGNFLSYGLLSLAILKKYIQDSVDNIFFVSHSPCADYLKAIKRLFPKSKRYFAIHDQGWTASLLGDNARFTRIMSSFSYGKEDRKIVDYVRRFSKEEKRMYRLAHRVICLCQNTKKLLIDVYGVKEAKIRLIPNGRIGCSLLTDIEKLEVRKRLGISTTDIILLYVGRMVEAKGVFELLRAFEILWSQNHRLHLVMAGEVFNLNDFVKYTPNSASHVTYTGLLDKDRLSEWYEIANVGILPSYTEQCSYTAIEMMLHRLPIITTNGNGLADMFRDGENALVMQPCKDTLTESIVQCVTNMLGYNKPTLEKMVESAYVKACTDYSIETMYNHYCGLFYDEYR